MTLDDLIAEFNDALADITRLIDGNDGWGYAMIGEQMMRNNPLPKWLEPNEDYTRGRLTAEAMSGLQEKETAIWQRPTYDNNNVFRKAMRRTYRAAKNVADHPGGLVYWKLAHGGSV